VAPGWTTGGLGNRTTQPGGRPHRMPELLDAIHPLGKGLRGELAGKVRVPQGHDHGEPEQTISVQLDEVGAPRVLLHLTDGSPPAFELQPPQSG
jgi:hypothetical protein